MTKTASKAREYQDHPIASPPSPWWTIMGLVDGTWYELFQYPSEAQADHDFGVLLDDDTELYEKYEDYAVLPPAIEHSIPTAKGQTLAWLESILPATRHKRDAQKIPSARSTSTRVGVRGRTSRKA